MGKINTKESQEAVNPANTGKTQEIQRDEKGRFPPGVSGNPSGPKPGYKQFDTIFDEAIKEIAESKDLRIDNPEKKLMIKAVIEALKGNHNFWKSLAEFRYGKPKEQLDLTSGGEPLGIIFLPRRKQDENKQLEEPQKND